MYILILLLYNNRAGWLGAGRYEMSGEIRDDEGNLK
jgi:hypothetical protein